MQIIKDVRWVAVPRGYRLLKDHSILLPGDRVYHATTVSTEDAWPEVPAALIGKRACDVGVFACAKADYSIRQIVGDAVRYIRR